MTYEKAEVKLILFDDSDVIMTSGGECRVPGWERGNQCPDTSSDCHNQAWKPF